MKRPLGKSKQRWKVNSKVHLKNTVNICQLESSGIKKGSYDHSNNPSGFTEARRLLF